MTTPAVAVAPHGIFTAAVAEELRVQMARKRITGRELSRRLHVSAQWISQRTRGVVPMNTDDIEMIASALGIGVLELLSDAGRRVAEATPADQGSGVTGTYTPEFLPPTSSRRGPLSLVPSTLELTQDVPFSNGSSPLGPVHAAPTAVA